MGFNVSTMEECNTAPVVKSKKQVERGRSCLSSLLEKIKKYIILTILCLGMLLFQLSNIKD